MNSNCLLSCCAVVNQSVRSAALAQLGHARRRLRRPKRPCSPTENSQNVQNTDHVDIASLGHKPEFRLVILGTPLFSNSHFPHNFSAGKKNILPKDGSCASPGLASGTDICDPAPNGPERVCAGSRKKDWMKEERESRLVFWPQAERVCDQQRTSGSSSTSRSGNSPGYVSCRQRCPGRPFLLRPLH